MEETKSIPVEALRLLKRLAPRLNTLLEGRTERSPEGLIHAEELVRLAMLDAIHVGATDLHLEPYSGHWRIRLRVDGALHDAASMPPEGGLRMARYLKTLFGLDPTTPFVPHDARAPYRVDDHRLDLRLACAPCLGGEKVAIRILDPNRIRHRIEELGLGPEALESVRHWLRENSGMCLVTGPTGSGKTTTLYALIRELRQLNESIVTIEDPVEYQIDGVTQIQLDDRHGLTFAEGLKTMLRLDPDYLVVGEMRDAESVQTAVEASGTGLVLMSTLHSRDAVGVLTMLRNWNISDHEIAATLEMVIAQRLVRRLCPECRERRSLDAAGRRWIESAGHKAPAKIWRAKGCPACYETGYRGLTGIFEIWRKSEEDYLAILDHANEHKLRQDLRARNVRSLLADGLQKMIEGITTLEEIQSMGGRIGFYQRRKGQG